MPRLRSDDELYLALLGFLRQRPMYGYELHQILSDTAELGLVWRIKQSQLYALLGKLEDDGYLTATVEPQGSRAPRKIFSLTEQGEQIYRSWVTSPVAHGRDFRIEFLAKLYFARWEGRPAAEQLIADQQTVCREALTELHDRAERLRERPYDWLVLQFRIGQLDAIISWLDLCAGVAEE